MSHKNYMSLPKEIDDLTFKMRVMNYIEQDVKDKAELKADLRSVKETITYQKVDIAVLQTKAGLIGAGSGIIFGGLASWLFSLFSKK